MVRRKFINCTVVSIPTESRFTYTLRRFILIFANSVLPMNPDAHKHRYSFLFSSFFFLSFYCNTKNNTYKARQTLPTIRYLYYLLYNTSLDYNSHTTFYSLFFGYTPMYLGIAVQNGFPLSLQYLHIIIFSSNVTFSSIFSFN